jgi:hypothetical protein
MYLDRICIDQHGRCSLEPGYATLGIWNVATRNKAEAWRPLGYIPNLYLLSKNENKFRMNSLEKLQMYKGILDAMLASVVKLHAAEVMVQSLLKSSLMVEENMLFPDMDNPLAPPPPTVGLLEKLPLFDTRGKKSHIGSAHCSRGGKKHDVGFPEAS